MARTVITITDASLKLADTEAGLTAAPDYQCQVTSAAINATPNMQTVPATFCAAESQAPAATGWELALTWLQDWTQAESLSQYAFDHDAEAVWFSLSLTPDGLPLATGQAYVVAGSFGGDAGTPLTATATWPCLAKPDIGPLVAAASEGVDAEAPADAPTYQPA